MSELPKTEVRSSSGGAIRITPAQALQQLHTQARILSPAEVEAIALAGLQQLADDAIEQLKKDVLAADTIEQLKKDLLFAANIHPRRTNAQKGLHCVKCRRALQDGEEIFGDVLHIRSNQIFTAHFIGWCLDCSSRYCFKDEESQR